MFRSTLVVAGSMSYRCLEVHWLLQETMGNWYMTGVLFAVLETKEPT